MIFDFKTLKSTPILVLLMALTFILSSCEEDCEEPKVDDLNAFFFEFKLSGANSYSVSELDSIYIVRFQDMVPDSFSFPLDTLTYFDGSLADDEHQIRLSQGNPFKDVPPPYFPQYKYKILSTNQDMEHRIEQIELEGSYVGDCEYVNSEKSIVFNGDTLDFIAGMDEIIFLEKP